MSGSVRDPAATVPFVGLTEEEARYRRAHGQGNVLPTTTTRSYRAILTENLFTFVNLGIISLGLALALLGRVVDAVLSGGAIAVNAVISIIQEIRAKRALDRIAVLNRPYATVVRDGQARAIAPHEIVLGDVVCANAGDQIVVDGTLLDGRMQIDESQLTGESTLVSKLPGRSLFSGSFCVGGDGHYVVTAVGSDAYINTVQAGARARRRIMTPLQRQINLVIRLLLLVMLYFESLLLLAHFVREHSLSVTIENSALLAGLVPNGLLIAIVIAYSLATLKVSRAGALVQQINAIESLSNVDVLCLDKTGTLTTNNLRVTSLQPLLATEEHLRQVLGWLAVSTPGVNKTSEAIAAAFPGAPQAVSAAIPFASARKWSAVLMDGETWRGVYALGAPEMVRPYLDPDALDWQVIADHIHSATALGLRVLLLSHESTTRLLVDDGDASVLPQGLRPLGLICFKDELRPEAQETLDNFRAAGVVVKIISGDHPETVAALATQAGLDVEGRVVSGGDLAALDATAFSAAAAHGNIFGRVTPQQKAQLVRALRARGQYVAMIGDGVNDILSLKQAQVGIAMQSGSAATRGVADVVLTDDSFAALIPAMREGQRVVNGMEDILKIFLARILTIALMLLPALVVGTFPFSLRQVALVALLVAGIPPAFLALWAPFGAARRGSMFGRLVRFVMPTAIIGSILGLITFFLVLSLRALPPAAVMAENQTLTDDAFHLLVEQSRPMAQTALTMFLVFSGLLLLLFVAPPSAWWTTDNATRGDRRLVWLVLGLMVGFVALMAVPLTRTFYGLTLPEWPEIAVVIASVGVWLVLVRWFWRGRLLERFLGVDPAQDRS